MSTPFNPENPSEMRSILTSAKHEFSRTVLENDVISRAIMQKVMRSGPEPEDNLPNFWVEPYARNDEEGVQNQGFAIAYSRSSRHVTDDGVEHYEENTAFDYLTFLSVPANGNTVGVSSQFLEMVGETPSQEDLTEAVECYHESGSKIQAQMPGMIDIDPDTHMFELVMDIERRAAAKAKRN